MDGYRRGLSRHAGRGSCPLPLVRKGCHLDLDTMTGKDPNMTLPWTPLELPHDHLDLYKCCCNLQSKRKK